MATFTAKSLADGQLANAEGVLYTAPGATKTYTKTMHVFNTGAGSNTVTIWLKRGATSRKVFSAILATGQSATVFSKDEAPILTATDTIRGAATNATEVDYFITGVEET